MFTLATGGTIDPKMSLELGVPVIKTAGGETRMTTQEWDKIMKEGKKINESLQNSIEDSKEA